MDWLGLINTATGSLDPVFEGVLALAIAVLIMFASAKANRTNGYESRRSITLREAAKRQGVPDEDLKKASPHSSIVYLSDERGCQRWCERLSVSRQVLREAVQHVGPMAADIERYVRTRQQQTRQARAA